MQGFKVAFFICFVHMALGQAPGFGFGPAAPGAPAFGRLNLGLPAVAGGPASLAPFAPAAPAPPAPAPAHYNYHHGGYHDYAVPTSYKFDYGVKDPHTGDHKRQNEHKDKAHLVTGSFELVEPDGSTRLVEYVADEHKGFQAHITKKGPYLHPHGAHSYHNMNLFYPH